MTQLETTRDPIKGYVGAQADGCKPVVLSRAAAENINFGDLLVEDAEGKKVRKPMQNGYTITLDADLVASNSITGTLNFRELDDAAFTEKTIGPVVYATSHDNTMDLIKAELEAELGAAVESVTLSDTTDNRQLTIVMAFGYEIKAGTALAVTGGAGQAGVAEAASSNDVIVGIAMHQHRQNLTLNTESSYYEKYAAVKVAIRGTFWVKANAAATTGSTAYAKYDETDRGVLAVASTDAIAVGNATFRSSADADALSKLELNK